MNVPLVDLKAQYESIKEEIDRAISLCLEQQRWIGGEIITEFEKNFAKYCGAKYVIGTSSGTSALSLAMKSYCVDFKQVILPSNTFIATAEAITEANAHPKFVDVDNSSYNIDAKKLRKAVTDDTIAIVPVHLFGQPADMTPILNLAKEKDLIVIEDAAQAHNAEYKGSKLPIAETGCYSFYPGKNLGAYGDAGAVVTRNKVVADEVRMMLNHGREEGEKYISKVLGSNNRIDTLQAAILNVKLKYLDDWTKQRIKNAKIYNDLFKDTEIITPFKAPNRKHVYHLYVVRVKERDKLQKFLAKKGIGTGIHYPIPVHRQKPFDDGSSFPVTERLSGEILSLPMYAELQEEQITYVVDMVKKFYQR